MARELQDWEKNNIFRSYLAEEIFQLDVLEKIHNDYKAHRKDKGEKITREELENILVDTLDDIISAADWYLDEEFEEVEGEDDYE